MNVRRLYAPVVLGTLAAGGLAFFAAGRTWTSMTVAGDGLPPDTVSVSGVDARPLISALALVGIASSLAILASSRRVRRAVGLLILVVGLVGCWLAFRSDAVIDQAMVEAVRESPAFTGANFPDAQSSTSWQLVAVIAFALAAVLGAVTAWAAPRWPTMSSRYDAPPVRATDRAAEQDGDMWKALDEGRDPTQ